MLTPHRRSGICRVGGLLLAALSCWAAGSVQPAAAQSLFEALFGGAPRFARPEPLPPQTSSYADPLGLTGRDSRRPSVANSTYGGYGGHGTAFCVRTCDGRYFPHAAPRRRIAGRAVPVVLPGEQDHGVLRQQDRLRRGAKRHALCRSRQRLRLSRPATSRTAPATARMGSGSRAWTRAPIRPCARATSWRPTTGFVSYRGKSAKTRDEFTPINPSSSAWARRLSEVKIRPAPPEPEDRAGRRTRKPPQVVRKEPRRAQLDR